MTRQFIWAADAQGWICMRRILYSGQPITISVRKKEKVFSYCLTAYIDLILHPTRKVNLWVVGILTKSQSSILLGILVVCLIPWFSTALNSLLGSWSCVGLNLLKLFQWITTIQEIICLETTHFLKEWKLWRLVNNNHTFFSKFFRGHCPFLRIVRLKKWEKVRRNLDIKDFPGHQLPNLVGCFAKTTSFYL